MKIRLVLLALLFTLTAGGCSSLEKATQEVLLEAPAAVVSTQEATMTIPVFLSPTVEKKAPTPFIRPTLAENTPLPPSLPTHGDNPTMTPLTLGLQSLTDRALADLATRLSITAANIKVLEAVEVTWPDSSLGCPQAGMAYAEVLTPGYRIILEYGTRLYEYHAGKGTEVIYCSNPTAPVSGTPGNT